MREFEGLCLAVAGAERDVFLFAGLLDERHADGSDAALRITITRDVVKLVINERVVIFIRVDRIMREVNPRLFAPPIDIICGHSDAIVSRERDLSVGRAEAIRACGLLHAIEIEHKVVRREAGRVCELDGLTRAVARSEDFAGDGRRRLAQRDLCRDFRIIDEWMFHHQVRTRDVVDEVVSLCHAHARALAERRDGIHAMLDRDARDR